VQHHALCRKYRECRKVRFPLAVHASRAVCERAEGVAETAGTAQTPTLAFLLGCRPESCRARLVDAVSVLGDRHGIVAFSRRRTHHAIAHVTQHARGIAGARIAEAAAARRQRAIGAGSVALHAVFRRIDLAAVGQGEGDLATDAGPAAGGPEARRRADAFAAEGVVGRGEDLDP
jgi:hypothetical protein